MRSSANAFATGSLNGRDIFPQRYASSQISTSSDHTKGPAAPRALRGSKTSPVPPKADLGTSCNPFIFRGNSQAFRPRSSTENDEKVDENDSEFFNPSTHLVPRPSQSPHQLPIVKVSNASTTPALPEVAPNDPTTSMAAQAMISLGAGVLVSVLPDMVPFTAASDNLQAAAVTKVPVGSEVDAISVVVPPAATEYLQAAAVPEVPVGSVVDAISVVVPPQADADIMTLPKDALRVALKDKLAAFKAQVENDALNKPNVETKTSEGLDQQAEDNIHWQQGEIMCFMLPKVGSVPEKLTNVYGTLAKDVFENCTFGTCVMQDGSLTTFSYSVVWAAKERMLDDKYRTRCPYTRLTQWFTSKRANATDFEREILASEQRYIIQ